MDVPQNTCGGQRTTCQSQFFPSVVWVPGFKLKSSGLRTNTVSPCRAISLTHISFLNNSGISASLEVLLSAWLPSGHPALLFGTGQSMVKLWIQTDCFCERKWLLWTFLTSGCEDRVVGGVWGRLSIAYSVSFLTLGVYVHETQVNWTSVSSS